MTVSLTLHLWWLYAYVLIGLVSFLPLAYVARRQTSPRRPFWPATAADVRRQPLVLLVCVLCWPLAAWEVFA